MSVESLWSATAIQPVEGNPFAIELPTALYIHVPFCKRRCPYCDFYTEIPKRDQAFSERYLAALERELTLWAAVHARGGGGPLRSIYYGGGTPSLLEPEAFYRFNRRLAERFPLAADLEWTLEANPSSVDPARLQSWREAGINRLSMGLQSADDLLLKRLGRLHTVEGFIRAYEQARAAGFTNISTDLIFGLPGQTLTDFRRGLALVFALQIDHLSAYALILEEGTDYYRRYSSHPEALPPEDEERAMYAALVEDSAAAGYELYELSNCALPGKQARHNSLYWRAEPYYAAGPGAAMYVGGERRQNPADLRAWADYYTAAGALAGGCSELQERVGRAAAMAEMVMLGFRLLAGPERAAFQARFGEDWLPFFGERFEALLARTLIESREGGYRLSRRGLDLANQVFAEFI